MDKVILLSRVSTLHQDLSQQTDELVKEAISQGFTKEQIIVIEDKESAIKLDEEERHGLNELKKHILAGSISLVICYEISRISRKQKVLYSIRDFLIEHKIQLIILKPYMKLLDNDMKMSQTASIMFSLFSSLSESEMMIKQERMMRGKIAKAKQGYFQAGFKVTFGYSLDDDGRIVTNEAERTIVEKIFHLLKEGNTIFSIGKEMHELGVFKHTLQASIQQCKRILHNTQYIGINKGINVFPPIISKELFDECQAILKRKGTNIKSYTGIKETYLCHRILKHKESGRTMVPNKAKNIYVNTTPDMGIFSIRMSAIEYVAWKLAKSYKLKHWKDDIKKEESARKAKVSALQNKISSAEAKISELLSKIDRIEDRVINGKISTQKADQLEKSAYADIEEHKKSIEVWKHQITHNHVTNLTPYKRPILETLSIKEKQEVVRAAIISITAEQHPTKKWTKIAKVTMADGSIIECHIYATARKQEITFINCDI